MAEIVDSQGRRMGRLRVSVTARCNFSCVYCRPEGAEQAPEQMSLAEMARVVRVGAGLGFARVRLTGGEPLVREGVVELVGEIAGMDGVREVAMTTNASLLSRHAAELKRAGLGRLNISLDTLGRETARMIARVDVLPSILDGIDAALAAGFQDLRFNAVVMAGVNDQELGDLVRFAHGRGATMRFIEYMPMGSARFEAMNRTVSVAAMRGRLATEGFDLAPDPVADPAEPSRNWTCQTTGARVGFISSMTEHFCGTCDRMRLTSDGRLRPCLHQEYEVDVRGRETDAEIEAAYREAARGKWAGHRMNEFVPLYSRREMISIGG